VGAGWTIPKGKSRIRSINLQLVYILQPNKSYNFKKKEKNVLHMTQNW
jgi:hypothetical protein